MKVLEQHDLLVPGHATTNSSSPIHFQQENLNQIWQYTDIDQFMCFFIPVLTYACCTSASTALITVLRKKITW